MLVYDEKVPKHFWRMAIVTGVLPGRDFEIRRAIPRIAKTNTIPKALCSNNHVNVQVSVKWVEVEERIYIPCYPVNHEYLWKKTRRTDFRNMMGEERLNTFMSMKHLNSYFFQWTGCYTTRTSVINEWVNALLLVCIHLDIFLDYEK